MEGTLFAAGSFSNPLTVTSADYEDYLNITFGAELVANISAVYPISMFNSTAAPALFAIAAVITDAEYACPTRRALKTSLKTQLGTYTYLWNHVPSCSWIPSLTTAVVSFLGPTHTSELAFVFDQTSNLPQPNGTCQLSASEQILTIQIVTAWQSMSKNGYPTLADGSKWPDWSQGEQGAIFDGSLTFGIINMTQCDFWDTIQMANSTNTTKNNTSPMTTSVSAATIIITLGASAFYDGSIVGFVLATFFALLNM